MYEFECLKPLNEAIKQYTNQESTNTENIDPYKLEWYKYAQSIEKEYFENNDFDDY